MLLCASRSDVCSMSSSNYSIFVDNHFCNQVLQGRLELSGCHGFIINVISARRRTLVYSILLINIGNGRDSAWPLLALAFQCCSPFMTILARHYLYHYSLSWPTGRERCSWRLWDSPLAKACQGANHWIAPRRTLSAVLNRNFVKLLGLK